MSGESSNSMKKSPRPDPDQLQMLGANHFDHTHPRKHCHDVTQVLYSRLNSFGSEVTLGQEQLDGGHHAVPWKVADAVYGIGLIAAGLLVAILVLVLTQLDAGSDREVGVLGVVVVGLLEVLMLVAVWLFGIKKYGAPWRVAGLAAPRHNHWLLLAALALVLSLVLTAVYALSVSAAGADILVPPPVPVELPEGGPFRLLLVLVLGILGPFAEEVFFRGFLLAALVPAMGVMKALLVTSAIFAIGHGVVAVMIPLFITGMLLSWLYLKTGSIWPGTAAHVAQNLLALLVSA